MPFDGTEVEVASARVMPDQVPSDPRGDFAWLGPLTRMGERLASAETEIKALKEDSGIIRRTLHELSGKMQLFVIAEQNCAKGLEALSTQIVEHTKELRALVSTSDQAKGAWKTIVTSAVVFASFCGLIGWLLTNYLRLEIR